MSIDTASLRKLHGHREFLPMTEDEAGEIVDEIDRLRRELAEARKAAVPWRDLQDWYSAQCNGEWEHMYGIKIETLDNPGWWFRVDLEMTGLIDKPFTPVSENDSSHGRWLDCKVNNIGEWSGSGDETRLAEIVTRFLDWAKTPATPLTLEAR